MTSLSKLSLLPSQEEVCVAHTVKQEINTFQLSKLQGNLLAGFFEYGKHSGMAFIGNFLNCFILGSSCICASH
jgi:hypothetical protein